MSRCNCTPPFSATLTIAARCDLNDVNGTYPDEPLGHDCDGATDAKVRISSEPASKLKFRSNVRANQIELEDVVKTFSCTN